MKILKTITAAALLIIGTTVMAQGQGNRTMRSVSERAKSETERMVKSLELNADQTTKIQEINLKFALKDSVSFAAMRNNASATVDRDAMRVSRDASTAAKVAEVKAVLTDDQKTKYDALIKENLQRGNRQGGQGNRPAGGGQGNRPEGGQPQGGQQ